jgi:hypothetical protein
MRKRNPGGHHFADSEVCLGRSFCASCAFSRLSRLPGVDISCTPIVEPDAPGNAGCSSRLHSDAIGPACLRFPFGHVIVNGTHAQNPPDGAAATVASYRPVLAVAFLACLLCLLFALSGWFEELPLPTELHVLVGLCLPVISTTLILYPSTVFRDRCPALRMAMLVGLGVVLFILAAALLGGFSLLLFAFGIISPE